MKLCSKYVRKRTSFKQEGVGLIEILVTLVVLGVGIIGIVGLQTTALKNNNSAMMRSQAVILSYAMFDILRANRTAAMSDSYDMSMSTGSCPAPSASGLVGSDQTYWIGILQAALGNTACGSIDCDNGGNCTLQVRWDDQNATDGSNAQILETRTRL